MGKPPAASRDLRKVQGSDLLIPRKKPSVEAQERESGRTPAEATLPDQNLPALEVNLPESEDFKPALWEADVSNMLNWSSNVGNATLKALNIFDQDPDLMSHSTPQESVQFGSTDQGLLFDDNCMRSISTSFHNVRNNGPRGSADALFLPIIKPESSNPLCDCTSLVSFTLRDVDMDVDVDCRVWDEAWSTKKTHSTLTIDRILIINKAAIENAYRILACPCSFNPGISLAITLICYHVIERYEAIIRATPANHSTSGPPTASAANLLTTRITVGEFQIDAEDEQRMRVQLVVNELRKVRGLVDRYGERYCRGLDGDTERHEGLHSALGTFLKSKLKETVNYMAHTLQN